MTRFFRLLARIRYWKRRALVAERRNIALAADWVADSLARDEQLKAEYYRNMSREDMFVSASVLGAKGMYGVAPRVGPVPTKQPQSILQTVVPQMSAIDKMEFETEILPYAIQNGHTRQQAEQWFIQTLADRKTLNDDPTIG